MPDPEIRKAKSLEDINKAFQINNKELKSISNDLNKLAIEFSKLRIAFEEAAKKLSDRLKNINFTNPDDKE